MNKIFHGLFQDNAHLIPDHSVDLVVTSPPYANQRKESYGGIEETLYPAWTVEWMSHLKHILKPTGSVIINIRPHVKDGEISDYMLHTRLAIRADGWKECDEWIWYKPDAPPLGHVGRPKRSWESLHWFSLDKNAYCDPKANGKQSKKIGFVQSKSAMDGIFNGASEGMQEGIARSHDIIIAGISDNDKSSFNSHPAQYPSSLVSAVIKVLSPSNGLILDPFMGSGTTAIAALECDRQYIGFEKEQKYVEIIDRRISEFIAKTSNSISDEFFNFG